ncbi:Gfo/Idh/MocA family protein [Paracoccus sp. JM45]|uniref:Gfo/Idh/MocA family protein n=1 Tax=Paracoccus sp. JM45 TaxID=2283626 RepID=UPI000E6CB0CE|nr:Gfo/Idh/MocA family oxidoreductase [Paracoccus sp. JM45]RJE79154.1 gfo/Idh/MocA family oxidoreductase [Paracoccus sp. JM45]
MAKSLPRGRVGVALIGAGMIAQTHVAALSAAKDDVQLKAIVSRTPERAAYLGTFWNDEPPKFTANLTAVAADPAIQVAIVATPPSVRNEVIEELASAGTHILLEKPVARTLEEAVEVVKICERAGVTLGMVFQHRMRASSIAATRYVTGGTLGKLGHVEIAIPLWRDQSYYDELGRGTYARDGGGVLMTNAIHSIDFALSLTGPVASVQAMIATTPLHRMEAEDLAVAGLRFACGAAGSFVASTAAFPHRTEVIRLHFENASLRIDKDDLQVNWRDGLSSVEAKAMIADGDGALCRGKYEWHQAVILEFVDAIRDGRKPLVTGRDALISHQLIKAIETSSRLGSPFTIVPDRLD